MLFRATVAALLASCALASSGEAASFSHYTSNEGREIILLDGEIASGDFDQLASIVREVNARDMAISGIRLNSPGGSLFEGVRLAAALKGSGIATVVSRGTVCASACFIAFAAGSEKFVSYGARVGVHGASIVRRSGSKDRPSGTVAMAKIVKELGVPPGIIGQMVVTSSDDIVWLSPADLRSMGVTLTGTPGDTAVAQTSGTVEQTRADPAALRKAVAPLIRALTDCVARETLRDDEAVAEYKAGTLANFTGRAFGRCPSFVNSLVDTYDRMDGPGRGFEFLNGPYTADLPRAVLKRIKPQLDVKLVAYEKDLADRAFRAEQERQAAEERKKVEEAARIEQARADEIDRQAAIAVAQQRAAEARTAAARAEAETQAIAVKLEADHQQQIAEAKQAEGLLVSNAADCARRQLSGLVKSGENAEVLAAAVLTLCGTEVTALLDGGINQFRLERSSTAESDAVYREQLRGAAREQVVALAVQAKAGVGAFAPAKAEP